MSFEAYQALHPYLTTNKVGADVKARIQAAANISQQEVDAANKVRNEFAEQLDGQLKKTPIIALPTLPHFPLARAQALKGEQDLLISALVRPFNVSGHPAISLPITTLDHKPVSLQLVAARGQDELLCQVATALSEFID